MVCALHMYGHCCWPKYSIFSVQLGGNATLNTAPETLNILAVSTFTECIYTYIRFCVHCTPVDYLNSVS